MLMCKLRYFAKGAESTFCSLSLPAFGNVVVSQGAERKGDGAISISRREGGSNVSFFVSVSDIENWLRLMSDILSRFLTCQSSPRWANSGAVTALQ